MFQDFRQTNWSERKFIIAPITVLLIFVFIKTIEEPEAIRKFGDEYIKYMREVPMFNLSLSCL